MQRIEELGGKAQSAQRPRKRRFPIGTEVLPRGGAHFRVWAPQSQTVAVELQKPQLAVDLEAEGNGYFSGVVPQVRAGALYKYRLEQGTFPDPVSRFQPEGPHGPSQIVDPTQFPWGDRKWRGVTRAGQVIYELHIGTFTPQGTYRAAMEKLPDLAQLGITLLEMMPLAEFPGRFGWGYDGVNLFAPTRLYGDPDDLRAFVDRAHALGMGVIQDVVYNHVGPDGNYLKEFSVHYFTDRYANEWGEAINFDGEHSRPVREFFGANAGYWIDEFHFDGLRLDATQQIFDASRTHILTEIGRAVRAAGKGRSTYVVSENEAQCTRLVRSEARGGYGLDALWNDDFHHSARVALTGRNEAYYCDYKGTPQEFISAAKWGYLYQGQWSTWQKKNRGQPALDVEPERFVTFLQNHDQIANSLRGLRMQQLTSPAQFRAMTALLLLGPGTPMLFQGQEFWASAPFLFFADHSLELARLVGKGRKEFLQQFKSIACPDAELCLSDPGAEKTFEACKLDWRERKRNAAIHQLHADLLRLRREDPVFKAPGRGGVDGAVLGPEAFVLRFFGKSEDRLLLINLGLDLRLKPWPEPLLAPPEECHWRAIWSSESTAYGGCSTAPLIETGNWVLPGRCALVLAPVKVSDGNQDSANRS